MSDWADVIRYNTRMRDESIKLLAINDKMLSRIRNHSTTKVIRYPEMKEAFDYVHELYPSVGVKQSMVYHAIKPLMIDIGYTGVGGFYDTRNRVIVITDWIAPSNSSD